jgi:hypothetical protein
VCFSTPDPPSVGSFVVFSMLDPTAVGFVSHAAIVDSNPPEIRPSLSTFSMQIEIGFVRAISLLAEPSTTDN